MLKVKVKGAAKDRKKIIEKINKKGMVISGSEETEFFVSDFPLDKDIRLSFDFSFDKDDDRIYEVIEYLFKLMGDN